MAKQKSNASNTILDDLVSHLLYLGASLATTIISTFLGNYSSALLSEVSHIELYLYSPLLGLI